MHGLARQLTRSATSRILRHRITRKSCRRQTLLHATSFRSYTTSSAVGSRSQYVQLLASIQPGVPEAELAKSIVQLITTTSDRTELARLNSLVTLYASGLDASKLCDHFSKYLKKPPVETVDLTAESPSVEVDEELTTDDLLEQAEVVLSRRKLEEDELAKTIVLLMKSTNDKVQIEKYRSLVSLFQEAARNAERASQGFSTTSLFGHSRETDAGEHQGSEFLAYDDVLPSTQIADEQSLTELSDKLDSLLENPTGLEGLESLVPHFMNEKGQIDTEIAGHLQELGIDVPSSTEAETESSFQSTLRENSRNSEEDDEELDASLLLEASSKQKKHAQQPFPNLMTPDPLMDSRDVREFPPDKENPYHNRVVIRNHSSIFHEQMTSDGFDFEDEGNLSNWKPEKTDETEEELTSDANLPLSREDLGKLYRFPIFSRRVTQQTGKGKIHRMYHMVIVGNGDGLVGYGEGKDDDSSKAEAKAFQEAVRNMDYVERFEKRTIWTEMETKLGATHVIMRPRPVGFGLRCNPNIHQVLKAAGIKDISAKVWGSRNPLNVIKATFRMLQSGNAPLAMGDGTGGKGRKLNKGSGARSMYEVERERGRKLISLRK